MATIYGVSAVWLDDRIGSLEIGKDADFIVIDTKQSFYHPRLLYTLGLAGMYKMCTYRGIKSWTTVNSPQLMKKKY